MAGEGQARDYQIAARIERLPLSPWHTWMRSIVGTAMFFDAFDAVALAYVLPAIVPLWKLTPVDIGAILAIGYAGQIIGSIGVSGAPGGQFDEACARDALAKIQDRIK